MFDSIKNFFGKDLRLELINEIHIQKDILKKLSNDFTFDDLEKNYFNTDIYLVTKKQAETNLNALVASLNKYLVSDHDAHLKIGKVEKYRENPLPEECRGYVYTLKKIPIYKQDVINSFVQIENILEFKRERFNNYREVCNFWRNSNFNEKFEALFYKKLQRKIMDELKDIDPMGHAFVLQYWKFDSTKYANLINLMNLIALIEFYFNVRQTDGSGNLINIGITHDHGEYITFVRNCGNFKGMLFIKDSEWI